MNERRDKINIIAEIKVLNADKCKDNLKFGCLLEAASRGKLCGTAQSWHIVTLNEHKLHIKYSRKNRSDKKRNKTIQRFWKQKRGIAEYTDNKVTYLGVAHIMHKLGIRVFFYRKRLFVICGCIFLPMLYVDFFVEGFFRAAQAERKRVLLVISVNIDKISDKYSHCYVVKGCIKCYCKRKKYRVCIFFIQKHTCKPQKQWNCWCDCNKFFQFGHISFRFIGSNYCLLINLTQLLLYFRIYAEFCQYIIGQENESFSCPFFS